MRKLIYHWHSFKQAWITIFKAPVEHLINLSVLALIIALSILSLSFNNSLNRWQQNNIVYPQIVVYMDKTASNDDIAQVDKAIQKLTKSLVRDYHFISKQQGLVQLQEDKQLKEIASETINADDNPLPDVFVIDASTSESSELQRLSIKLDQLPKVDSVQADLTYASKVNDLINFSNAISLFCQTLFIVVLSLVVYNMVRLQMLLKSDAISVSRLIGASDSFIMRPLIHYVVWQITLATLFAGATIYYLTAKLNQLFIHFNNLFGNNLTLATLPLMETIGLWLILVIFSIFTVFLAVRWVFKNTHTY